MMNRMSTIKFVIFILMMTFGCVNQAQNVKPAGQGNLEKPQPATAEQKAKIKAILSGYKPSALTAADAKAIHEKFREAGIHAGPETSDAIKAAGFDPEKLHSLAPPPETGKPVADHKPTLEERMKVLDEKVIKPLSLTTAQKETVVNAFKVFYSGLDKLIAGGNAGSPPDKSKVEPFEKTRDAKIKLVLNDALYKKYLELEKATRPPSP